MSLSSRFLLSICVFRSDALFESFQPSMRRVSPMRTTDVFELIGPYLRPKFGSSSCKSLSVSHHVSLFLSAQRSTPAEETVPVIEEICGALSKSSKFCSSALAFVLAFVVDSPPFEPPLSPVFRMPLGAPLPA